MGVYKNKEDYLKALCIAHPLVAHGAVVAGVVRKSFFRINGEEEITDSTLNDIAFPCVAYYHIEGRLTDVDNALADIRHTFKNGWMFLDHVIDRVDVAGIGSADRIEIAYDKTFSIMEDYLKAMKDDYEESGSCGVFEDFNLNKVNYVQVGPIGQNEFGWILYFEDTFKATRVITGGDPDSGEPPFNPYRMDPEIIPITNEDTKTVVWTDIRKDKYGAFPIVEVWLRDQQDVLYLSTVQPTIDAAPPAFTEMYFLFTGLENGFIIIR